MVDDRLVRYLENPATREAAAIIAASWAHHQDSERLTKDLDFLEEEVAKRQPPEPEPVDEERLNAFIRKVNAFDSRFAKFTVPILDAAVKGELDYAEEAFARLEEHVKSIQQGSDTPLSVRWRGEFEASVLYKPGDLVTLNGSAFVCVTETSSKPSGISREWDLLSSVISGPAGAAGLPGSQGPQGPQGPPGVGTAVTFQEVDGVPSGTPDTLIFPNGTLTDNLDGSYTYSPAALGSITIEEVDGVPTGTPGTLKFPNGSLTDNGDGSFTYTAPAGGAIDVTDGTTTVSPATSLAFGASMVTDSGGGVATISNSHDLLSAVSADDHHAQSHAHNGADSSGTVAHSATTGQTANDHHNQSHSDTDHSDGPNAKPGHAHSTHSSIGANDHHAQAHKTEHEPGGGDAMTVDAVAATGSLRTLGTGSQQAAAGNDSRLSDARTPTAHHVSHEVGGGDAVAVTHAQTTGQTANDHHAQAHHAAHEPLGADPMTVDAAAATGSLRTLGTGSTQAAAGNDSRLSDARTPTAHHTSHEVGQSDAVAITHAQTTGQTANDHHAQSHTHASHTSIGADDHHAQNHNLVDTTGHPVSGLTTGHYLKALSATTFGFAALPATPITPVVNVYTGNNTWTKPANCTVVFAIAIGGGGSGGSGRKGLSGSARYGGGGGAGGSVQWGFFQAATVATGGTESITVGAQVNGGNAVTGNSTDGNAGNTGNDSKFGSWLTGKGGGAGAKGTATGGAASGIVLNYDSVQIFGTPAEGSTTPANGGNSLITGNGRQGSGGFAGGGGAGGGIDGSDIQRNGGTGGSGSGGAGGASGGAGTGAGGAGGTGSDAAGGGGGGGGSAYGFLSLTGNTGGDGGEPGGGGGGGGAGLDSTADSGAGGKGAKGRVVVIAW